MNSAFADVAADPAVAIVGGEARVGHRRRLHAPDAGAEGVFLAHRAGDDLLEVHADFLEEVLRAGCEQWKQTALSGSVAVVVVPVEQRAGRARGERESVHRHHAADVDFAGAGIRPLLIMLIMVQGTTP